jgi:CHASE1-domain containing sensor protein
VFLLAIIVTVLPITMTIAALAARLSPRVNRQALAHEAPSGSSGARLMVYDQR